MDTLEMLREEAEMALRDLLKARPALKAAVETATQQAFEAAKQFENFALQVARGTRHGRDQLAGAVAQALGAARRHRDAANAALTRAERELQNLDWGIDLRRADIAQLALVEQPPVEGRGPVYEIAKRPRPPGFDVVDDNIIPGGKPPPDSAA
jgi:hypothetical protein